MLSTRAPGKVNLCLLVGAPRGDGLHPLVSVFQPVSLADEVTLAPRGARAGEVAGAGGVGAAGDVVGGAGAGAAGGVVAGAGGAGVPGVGAAGDLVVCPGVAGENLAARALAEFRAATGWAAPPQLLTIAKRIPVAAGMGGGSADAAAALRLAAAASGLPIPPGLAMRLGADVPVLLHPTRALVTGAGEHVEPLAPPPPHTLVIVPLGAALSTAAVYRAYDELSPPRSRDELAAQAARLRAGGEILAVNDLEAPARRLCPAIDPALEALRAAGVERPMVTGSGPTVFGFSADAEAAVARLHAAGYARATAARPVGPDHAEVT